MKSLVIEIPSNAILSQLIGNFDENINLISSQTGTLVYSDGKNIILKGENIVIAENTIKKLLDILQRGEVVDKTVVNYCIELAKQGNEEKIHEVMKDVIAVTSSGKPIKCKTLGQKKYVDLIKKNEIVFGVGPAGTGKTYLAVAMAVNKFKNKEVDKIILTRPAVEAGESLGFLPGDLQSKVDPYLRPLYDALQEMFGLDGYNKLMEKGVIEVAPLAYMRGRTLNNAFIILDEAQNTTKEQMKMFLTRMGEGSRMVITGDITQIDLPRGKKSGLIHATKILKKVEGIGISYLTSLDVVRHSLVMKIIKAYTENEKIEDKQ